MSSVDETIQERPVELRITKLLGPGLLVAASGIGAGDIVSATLGGANYGLALLWVVALAAILKYFISEGIARWQLATDMTAIEGWAAYLPGWVQVYFAIYLILWTIAISAALTNACGLGIENLTGGAVPRSWGAVIHSVLGFGFVFFGGFKGFDKITKLLVGTMFFSIVLCAVLTFQNPADTLKGLFVPTIPAGGASFVLSLLGGIGGSITILSYNYWLREEKMAGPRYMKYVRTDLAIAYIVTAVFGFSVITIANQAFHSSGITITDSQAVPRMAETLAVILGPVGFYGYAIGFWAAVFAALLGVWQGVSYLFADFYGLARKYPRPVREQITQVTSTPYRLALLFITLAPIPFAFVNRPLFIIKTYTIVGSLFIPFVAATLLYLNNRRIPAESGVKKNGMLNNILLWFALLLFSLVGIREALSIF